MATLKNAACMQLTALRRGSTVDLLSEPKPIANGNSVISIGQSHVSAMAKGQHLQTSG